MKNITIIALLFSTLTTISSYSTGSDLGAATNLTTEQRASLKTEVIATLDAVIRVSLSDKLSREQLMLKVWQALQPKLANLGIDPSSAKPAFDEIWKGSDAESHLRNYEYFTNY